MTRERVSRTREHTALGRRIYDIFHRGQKQQDREKTKQDLLRETFSKAINLFESGNPETWESSVGWPEGYLTDRHLRLDYTFKNDFNADITVTLGAPVPRQDKKVSDISQILIAETLQLPYLLTRDEDGQYDIRRLYNSGGVVEGYTFNGYEATRLQELFNKHLPGAQRWLPDTN